MGNRTGTQGRPLLKTDLPMILTARIAEEDLQPFDQLRSMHFPPDRNHLHAHLTMFHRLPGECLTEIEERLSAITADFGTIVADVSGLRHLGAGVAFTIISAELQDIRSRLKAQFAKWLGPQDGQKWQPHITVQNKVSKAKADALYRNLGEGFKNHTINIPGVTLWRYLGGPWNQIENFNFAVGNSHNKMPKKPLFDFHTEESGDPRSEKRMAKE